MNARALMLSEIILYCVRGSL